MLICFCLKLLIFFFISTVNLPILRVPELFVGDLLIPEVSEGIPKRSNVLKKLIVPQELFLFDIGSNLYNLFDWYIIFLKVCQSRLRWLKFFHWAYVRCENVKLSIHNSESWFVLNVKGNQQCFAWLSTILKILLIKINRL